MTPRPFPVSPPDSAWLRMESPTNAMTITGVLGFGSEFTMDHLREFVGQRLVPFDRFRMKIEGAGSVRPRWVPDETFDLDAHLHEVVLPEPAGKAELEALVSRLMSEPLSFDRSPWSFHLVRHVGDEAGVAGSAVVGRIHHVIGDGIALMHVLIHAVDEYYDPESPTGRKPRGPKAPVAERLAETLKSAGAETADLLLHPTHLGRRLLEAGSGVGALGHLLAMRPDSRTPFKGDATTDKRAAWTAPIPLDLVKAVGDSLGAKVNDVLMSAAGGAVRRFFESVGQPVDGVTVRVAVPFNVRPLERAHELGNSFALVFVELPVSPATARERLAAVKAHMDAVKASAEPAVVFGILQSIGRAPMWVHRQVVKMFSEKASGVLTNVPGPTEPLHIAGVPLTTLMFWVPQAGDIGLGLSLLSLDGTVRVGVTTDAAFLPDPSALARAFEEEFAALADEFGAGPAGGQAS